MEWFVTPETQVEVDAAPDALSGTVRFEGLQAVELEAPQPGAGEDSLSGTISWTCE
jgi:hypothetical protein